MTPEQQAAFIISQSVGAMIEAVGMMTENQQRERGGLTVAYTEKDFEALSRKYLIGHNAVVDFMRP